MKRVIVIILIAGIYHTAYGQTPVTDVGHAGISSLGWLNSLEEAILNTTEITKVLGIGKETVANLQDIKNVYNKINKYLLQAQEIEYAIRDLADMGGMLSEFGRTIVSANTTFSMDEKRRALEQYNAVLTRATRNLRALHDCMDEGKFAFTDYQRRLCMNQNAERIRREREMMQNFDEKFRRENAIRKQIIDANKLLTPAQAVFYEEEATHNALDLAAVVMAQMSAAIDNYQGGDEKMSESGAKTEIKDAANVYTKLWYVLCAIIALIGAYRVYAKVQLGDDLGKSVWWWFGAALLLYFAGLLVERFFLQ